jgi:hypothetical protein
MSHAINALAAARDALVNLTEKSEAMHGQQSQLLMKLSEAQARSTEALRLARASGDEGGKHALAMKIADQDAADLQALVDQGAQALLEANCALALAKEAESRAVHTARREEMTMTATELDKALKDIETQFLACMAERARVQHLITGQVDKLSSCFTYWKPSKDLFDLVTRHVVPPAVTA